MLYLKSVKYAVISQYYRYLSRAASTVGLRQGLLDRLLNIGILEFAASGTDDVDIRFINIADPTGVKAEIAVFIEQQTQT